MTISRLAIAIAAIGLMTAPAFSQSNTVNDAHNAMQSSTLDVKLGEQNKSNQTGSVTIADVSGGVKVTIALKNEPAGASEPAHIHMGTCDKLNPAPWKPLNNVVSGSSVTTLSGVGVAGLKKGTYAVNVHESAANLAHYVACGDI
jgi:Cu/Zn superoxide dismutase